MAIERRGDGYRVRWWTLDGAQRSRQCPSRRIAQQLEAQIRDAHALGREWQPEPIGPVDDPSLREIAEAYQDARRLRCASSTMRVEAHHLDLFLRFVASRDRGPATTALLSRSLLDEFLAWLMRPDTGLHGRARAPGSAAKSVRAVQGLWRWAEDSERWPGQVPRAREVELPRVVPALVVAPTWEEMDRCVLECRGCRGWQRQLATWLRYTGLRAGESMLFEWRDIDLATGRLTIRPELDKSRRGRVIPLAPALLDEISTWGVREGFVIPTRRHRDTVRHRDPRARDLRRAWKRAGVRDEVWQRRPEHAFRRGWKSGLLSAGANADAVDFLQGHSLGAGSRGRYIDPWALPLAATVAMVPALGSTTSANVVRLDPRAR